MSAPMTDQERFAAILYFTYRAGWRDHVLSRLGRENPPQVPYVEDEEMIEWDELDPDTKARFIRSAEDFVPKGP